MRQRATSLTLSPSPGSGSGASPAIPAARAALLPAAALLVSALLGTVGEAAPALTRVTLHARIPRILGQPAAGFAELYEFDLWSNESGPSLGCTRRAGAPPGEAPTHDGRAPFDLSAGTYGFYLHQPEWFVRPAVLSGVEVREGAPRDLNIVPPLDYSCVMGKIAEWKGRDGADPWEWATVWHQTFVARGSAITHVEFKLAGHTAESARVSIHEADETVQPESWLQVGPSRTNGRKLGNLNDNWVGWRSGEVPTTPGRKYAVRIQGQGGQEGLGMLIHRDSAGPGYAPGTAYANGQKLPCDLHAVISSDSDGTVIPYMRIRDIKPGELGGSGVWAQSWKPQGRSLAAVDFLVAWGTKKPPVTAEIRVLQGGPQGAPVGPPKRSLAAWWAPGCGFLGAVWQPGELPLQPGHSYAVEVRALPPADGYNGCVVNTPENRYPDGLAFKDGVAQPDRDLEMTIVEYKECPKPPPPRPMAR